VVAVLAKYFSGNGLRDKEERKRTVVITVSDLILFLSVLSQ
jgi:hypothetical protein